MKIDFTKNHFELFGLPLEYVLDEAVLNRAYRDVQSEVHPDRFANATDTEKRLAAQWATRVNEAYRTLRSPLDRGRYFLKVHGIDTEEESNTAMPVDFLMQQMEWREAVADAKAARDEHALAKLEAQKRSEEKTLFQLLTLQLSVKSAGMPPLALARETVRKLRFLEKLGDEIDLAFEAVEG
jgi:molecular chaperone HscB